uniref:Uncharacterized protein n=1 Tax=Candidatus Kentrum sp. FM TaxID=2126340 RepID=A0A450TJT5_9GAMM|nr:MAG: hypothetical protein BECKFM1743C_GA0114222_102873 [Candidatus Kentron sp. FM]VFJ67771.1 MAG: hypothetical protein BECKFM1743A_GA0114220_104563 [Candidatus Kentron sp. FM]
MENPGNLRNLPRGRLIFYPQITHRRKTICSARPAILPSVHFLFFLYAFHAAISIRCWFAIDIAIRYRYRSCPAFPIASSGIDSGPEKTTTPVAVSRAMISVDTLSYYFFVDIIFFFLTPCQLSFGQGCRRA